jgi:glycosyltransferase involved in cell wall biosynthesis
VARTLFFLANLDPLDGSAHALYCVRNVISLAKNAPPGWRVELLHASKSCKDDILALHQTTTTPALGFTGLPHIRRRKGCPFHFNAVFHFSVLRHLRKHSRADDVVCTASFPEMFRFLTGKLGGSGLHLAYEIHQLEFQSRSEDHQKCVREFEALALAHCFITTCQPLAEILKTRYPKIPCHNLGLAASYSPPVRSPAGEPPLRVGYFGSLSIEQGVPWLAGEWKSIRERCGVDVELHIHGRRRKNDPPLAGDPAFGIHVHEPVPSNAVPAASASFDGLVIPALDQAHRASIAFTKAYDYTGLGLPVIASDLPTIREVLEPERHALYFQPGDASGLAQCISRLGRNPTLAKTIGNNLRQRASELSWDSRARRWWQAVLQ